MTIKPGSGGQPLSVAFVIASLGRGGAEKQLYLLLRELDRNCFSPYVLTYYLGSWAERIRALGIPVLECAQSRISSVVGTYRRIKGIAPGILHTLGKSAGYRGRIAGVLARVPIIISSERLSGLDKTRVDLILEKVLAKFTARIICNAQHSANYYIEQSVMPTERIVVIPNGIDMPGRNIGQSSDGAAIGYVAHFREEKNHEVLVRAAWHVASRHPEATFHLAGEGPFRPRIESLVDGYGLRRNFRFYGEVDGTGEVLSRISIYAQVSLYEGMPNALMEAMAYGLPCVVTNSPGNVELVQNGVCGLVVDARSELEVARAIERLMRDRTLAQALGQNAQERMRKGFGASLMADATMKVYWQEIHRIRG